MLVVRSKPSSPNSNGPCAPAIRLTSASSWLGICATSFFLAEANGVTMPFVNTYLIDCGWSYESIGTVAALAALVSWLMQLPVGLLIDRYPRFHRLLLASASLLVGGCMGLLPMIWTSAVLVGILLIVASLGRPLYGPLTNALTLQLVGHKHLGRAVGIRESWNHLGNIAAALTAMVLVQYFSVSSIFFGVALVSVLAAASILWIRSGDLNHFEVKTVPSSSSSKPSGLASLFFIRGVVPLLIASVLFHLANAPVMPLVAQKIKFVGGTDSQVAAIVLIAQLVMIPMSIATGALGPRFGQKPILAVGFLVLPIRIALYTLTDNPSFLVALQALDGVGVGIFDVAVVSYCAEMTRNQGRFNTLVGSLGMAIGVGGVAGPLLSGIVVQHWGFTAAFGMFAGIAVAAAGVFLYWMPSDVGTASPPAVMPAMESFGESVELGTVELG